MKSVKLLAISRSCLEDVNRAVYRLLATRYNLEVHLVIPTYNRVGAELKECSPVDNEPFETTLLDPIRSHLRLQRLKGLPEVIRRAQPSHILVEADPATFLTRDVTRAATDCGARVWALTDENLERNYLREAFNSLRRGHLKAAAGGFITWWLWRSSRHGIDHVFTISQDGTRVMSLLGFAQRVTQIPLGFDPQLFYSQGDEQIRATRRRLGLQKTTIAYFGRLIPEKGVELLLLALTNLMDLPWQLLIDKFSRYRLPYISKLQRQIETLGISDRVVFFDATHTEMPDYMNAADIVVLPSVSGPRFKEQYGRVLPEAMACGKIVVGSQSGAIPELIGDAGFLFPSGDAEALVILLRYLLTAPQDELDSVRAKAGQRANSKLSISAQADILAKMVNNSP